MSRHDLRRVTRARSALAVCMALIAALALVAGAFKLSPAVHANGNTILVTDCNGYDGNGGVSSSNFAPGSFGSAFQQATPGDTIQFECDATLFLDPSRNGPGTLTVGMTLTIDGNGHTVIFDGSNNVGDDSTRLFVVSGITTALTLNDLTIQHGSSNTGGGLYNGGTLDINNSTITSNQASGFDADGGGIYNNSAGDVNIFNSTVSNNLAQGDVGDPTQDGGEARGGGIFNNGTINIVDSSIINNQAQSGGITSPGHRDGFAGGGGLDDEGAASLTGSTVSNNQVGSNFVADGGGIAVIATVPAPNLNVTNSTIAGNQLVSALGNFGAGMYISDHGTATVTNSTIVGNQIPTGFQEGGGITYDGGTFNVGGSIIAENRPGGNCSPGTSQATPNDLGFTLTDDQTCGVGGAISDSDFASKLADNGGPTQTIALLDVAGNPAINAIPTNATFSDKVTPACQQTDQRGVKRPQGPACDIGAYEYRAPIIGVPRDIVTQTQSPSGARVIYPSPVRGTLPDNPAVIPTLTCVNASNHSIGTTGATFPVGRTVVTCTATDPNTPSNHVSASFTVTVNAPGINLGQASLKGDDFTGTDLSRANLNQANLTGANLSGANLTGAKLNQANLTDANLTGAMLTGANLNMVTWSGATCPDGSSANSDGGTCIGHLG